ncbi:MAG: GntR family transcriptional regulator [Janthinobacterium lividum]
MLDSDDPPRSRSRHTIERQSLPETLARSLQERILNGEFKEGESLIQEALAEEYEVSRMPVREALRQLEASGLVLMKTHKGAIVTSVPTEQIGELFDLRALLECDILGHALPKMTEAGIAASRTMLAQLEDAYRRGDVATWGALNWAFHRSLYEPSNRVQTLAAIQGINVQTDRYIRLQLQLSGPGAIADAEKEHREILRLCEAREPTEAVAYLRAHILNAGRHLLVALRNRTAAGTR